MSRLLSIECAGLGANLLQTSPELAGLPGVSYGTTTAVFPAVTCVSQASFRTGCLPETHTVCCNGDYDRRKFRVDFWNQSAGLVQGPRIWDNLRKHGGQAAMLFHQQSLGENVDIVLSPAPVHKHHGGMIQGFLCRPDDLGANLTAALGRQFSLSSYWGPLSNGKSTAWITEATIQIMRDYTPDMLLTYLPHLDYCQQKTGCENTPALRRECSFLAACLRQLLTAASGLGYEVLIWGDYAITPATGVIHPNRLLREAGFFTTRTVAGGLTYPNLYDSRAFAMSDHQVAHIFLKSQDDREAVLRLFTGVEGIDQVCMPHDRHLSPTTAGDLVLEAKPGYWFSYQWWQKPSEAPDYATHVDIHSKIGFDPCELFWKFPFLSTATDCGLPQGTHGRTDAPCAVAATPGLASILQSPDLASLGRAFGEQTENPI
ncbi:MAG: alkaline phosphatase family protein [Victivallales bacterium]|nr:alkaline phosphatase family protein [Victivallales bacterium]